MAHDLGGPLLNFYSHFVSSKKIQWKPLYWQGHTFSNPIGIGGGLDKNGEQLLAWQKMGVGFLEVGTVTPEAQAANPAPIIDRHLSELTLWNKMGFPNKGSKALFKKLENFQKAKQVPLFINIGKNRETPIEQSHDDYLYLIERLHPFADAFVVNISSPNTKNLRQIFSSQYLHDFLLPISNLCQKLKKPYLLKLSPDLNDKDFFHVIETSRKLSVAGWIMSNTTLHRPPQSHWPQEGGLSGLALQPLAENMLKKIVMHLGSEKSKYLIISTGGILTQDDFFKRLEMGADLVQAYAAFVFHGPQWAQQTCPSVP